MKTSGYPFDVSDAALRGFDTWTIILSLRLFRVLCIFWGFTRYLSSTVFFIVSFAFPFCLPLLHRHTVRLVHRYSYIDYTLFLP